MKITLCAISKNEETSLPLMLDSIKNLVDEIVIADTGSTDKTLDIARTYTDKVYSIEWENSFAKARNRALQHCTGDWILILDCDETFNYGSIDKIKSMLQNIPDNIDLLLVPLVMCKDDGTPYQQFPAERLIRGGKGIRFEGDMHNWVDVSQDRRGITSGISIIHNRAVKPESTRNDRAIQRVEMAESIFLKKIADNSNDTRSLFYLGGTYYDAGRIDDAIKYLTQYTEVSDFEEERYQAALLLSRAYIDKGDIKQARYTMSAHIEDNHKRSEGYMLLGEIALNEQDYERAIHWFKIASLCIIPLDPMFIEMDAYSFLPHQALWQCYKAIGDTDQAVKHGQMAIDQNSPRSNEILRYQKEHNLYGDQNILCLVDRGQMDFIQPLIDEWKKQGKNVRVRATLDGCLVKEAGCESDYLEWADIIWCEWAGAECANLTWQPKQARIIVRVHGYETHTGVLSEVNWEKVDDVIFVARYLEELAIEQCPEIPELCNCYVVPGGVETGKFSISNNKSGKKIAMACYGNQKKGFPLALQILAKCPDHELHIATEWQDHRLQMYIEHLIDEMGLQDRVFWYPWQENLNRFYADKDFYLSTSEEESFHYALAEGMAAGLKPVVHCWKSSSDFYPDQCIFRTVDEAVDMLNDASDHAISWRDYAIRHLSIGTNIDRINTILQRPSVRVVGEPRNNPYSFENKLLLGLQRLGYRTDGPDPRIAIITGHSPDLSGLDGMIKVLWHCEQVVGDDEHAQMARERIAPVVPLVDLVLTHNPEAVSVYKKMGAKRVEYLSCAVASWPFRKLDCEKRFDVGFVGTMNDRRDKILEELGKEFDIHELSTPDHEQINAFFNSCKVVLNLHCTDEPNLETRIGEAMSAGACVVSEHLPDGGHRLESKGLIVETNDLSKAIHASLDEDSYKVIGKRAYDWIWSHQTLEQQLEKLMRMAEDC